MRESSCTSRKNPALFYLLRHIISYYNIFLFKHVRELQLFDWIWNILLALITCVYKGFNMTTSMDFVHLRLIILIANQFDSLIQRWKIVSLYYLNNQATTLKMKIKSAKTVFKLICAFIIKTENPARKIRISQNVKDFPHFQRLADTDLLSSRILWFINLLQSIFVVKCFYICNLYYFPLQRFICKQ